MTYIIQAFHRFNHALPHSSDSQALCGDPCPLHPVLRPARAGDRDLQPG